MQTCPRVVYNEMLRHASEGEFHGARDESGNILISETVLRRIWPNWVVPMTKRYKGMCVCDKCGIPHDVLDSLNLKQVRILTELKSVASDMDDGDDKVSFMARIKKYEDDIMKDGALKCKKLSEAADELACEPILVDGVYLRRFECVIGECDTCKDKYEPVEFEKDCNQTIAYQLYVSV